MPRLKKKRLEQKDGRFSRFNSSSDKGDRRNKDLLANSIVSSKDHICKIYNARKTPDEAIVSLFTSFGCPEDYQVNINYSITTGSILE